MERRETVKSAKKRNISKNKKLILCASLFLGGCNAAAPLTTEKTYELGEEPAAEDFIGKAGKIEDVIEGLGEFKTKVKDEDGREVDVTIKVKDTTFPEWDYFEDEVITEQGKKPSYHFSATDAGKVTIMIEDDQVDIQTPGTYPCMAKAKDEAGNEIMRDFTVRVEPKDEMPKQVFSHVNDTAQKDLAVRIVDVLNSNNQDQALVVEESLSEEDWNAIHHVDFAVCDAMGWEYMDITDGYANPDDTFLVSVNPAQVRARAKYRNLSEYRLNNISGRAGIEKSDSPTTKATKLKDLILRRLQYTNEDIYPSLAVQVLKGNSMTYAMLFDQLAEYNGIPSDFITGYLGDDYHCWNRIWIDGQPKWIDLTLEQASPGHYFMKNHLWDSHELSLTEIAND
ncbi:transglutaminase-like domain-containing protein [Ileibacterium valens]|uniref:transglutaminase-like domain-containing protein n=1 Tax=Ileibacterium valens TaxID=1862668 RepID=UPI00272B4BE0|nr:transglutaminase-like domain-containing protein [Ileibacterium valens]